MYDRLFSWVEEKNSPARLAVGMLLYVSAGIIVVGTLTTVFLCGCGIIALAELLIQKIF